MDSGGHKDDIFLTQTKAWEDVTKSYLVLSILAQIIFKSDLFSAESSFKDIQDTKIP